MAKRIGIVGSGCSSLASEALKHLKCTDVPLASSLHEFKSPALVEAYQDSDLTPVGVGYLDEIIALKDQQIVSFPAKTPIIQKYKTGYYYLRKLSRSERKAFAKAFRTDPAYVPLRDWLSSIFEDLEDMINTSFRWEDTPDGYDYWDALATRSRWMISPPHMGLLDKINLTKL